MTAPKGLELPKPSPAYDSRNESDTRAQIQREINRCVKTDQEYQPPRLVLADTVTGTRYQLTVASGVLTLTAL